MNVGPLEIIILIVVVLLVFGARKLPELGSSLGQSIRGFGKGISGEPDDDPPQVEKTQVEKPQVEKPAPVEAAERAPAPPERRPG